MIRPLRVRHRWMLPALLGVLLIAVGLIVTFPPDARQMPQLPAAVVDSSDTATGR